MDEITPPFSLDESKISCLVNDPCVCLWDSWDCVVSPVCVCKWRRGEEQSGRPRWSHWGLQTADSSCDTAGPPPPPPPPPPASVALPDRYLLLLSSSLPPLLSPPRQSDISGGFLSVKPRSDSWENENQCDVLICVSCIYIVSDIQWCIYYSGL